MLKTNYSEFPHTTHEHMEVMMLCYTVTAACAKMCMEEGHKESAKLCTDCTDICALTIKLHSGNSPFNSQMMKLCAEACDKCANACEKMASAHCKQCSQICRLCAKVCREEG